MTASPSRLAFRRFARRRAALLGVAIVLGFIVPPGAGSGGVALQELFGFERVFVPAGQTVTVYLGAQNVRFTQPNKDGVREALPGTYKVRFGVRDTMEHGMGFAEQEFVME